MSKWVTVGKAAVIAGLDQQTIRKMADEASIVCYRTPSGQRRINLESIQKLCYGNIPCQEKQFLQRKNYIYARVSTNKQMDDLSRQISFLRRPEYTDYVLISDIGSGINFKRKGLATILEACLQRCVGEIVIAHRDRLCRFGYELIDTLVTKAGGKITVLDNQQIRTSEQELTDDLLAIIHVFSCRQMGKRNYGKRKKQNSEDSPDKDLSNGTTEEET